MLRASLLFATAVSAANPPTVLVFGDSWGDVGPGAAMIKYALKNVGKVDSSGVKNAAIGGTTACGWAKDPQAMVKAAQKHFPGLKDGPDFVWYTAGGNDLIDESSFHSCTKKAKSIADARACYTPATDIPIKCTQTMFDAYYKAFPNSKIVQCNYDIPCETGSCATGIDQGYLGNYCGKNITCLNEMALTFQNTYVGRLKQKYSEPQYTGIFLGGTDQAAAGDKHASTGHPDLAKTGPCDMMLACVHPESWSKAAHAIGQVFWNSFFSKYIKN